MTHKHSLSFFLILLCLPSYGRAQLWSGIIAPTRATDWTTAGVKNGIPSGSWTQCGLTIAAYTGDASTINNAIAACGTNQYVQLGAGTFTLSSGIQISKSNVVLRGMGANQTFLVISGFTSQYCGVGDGATIAICNSGTDIIDSAGVSWTAGYSQGTTQITLSSTTNLSVGSVIILDQLDDASDGWPSTGDIYVCQGQSQTCSQEGGGGEYARPCGGVAGCRAETEFHEVTAINGSTVTITPPVMLPNWRSSQKPGATWQRSLSNIVTDSGIENLSLDWTSSTTTQYDGIRLVYTKDCWIKGVRVINTTTDTTILNTDWISLIGTFRTTVQDSYIYGSIVLKYGSYSIGVANSGSALIQNNIIQGPDAVVMFQGPADNVVVGYNYGTGHPYSSTAAVLSEGPWQHGAGAFFNLNESNITNQIQEDSVHGTHDMNTHFRNSLLSGLPGAQGDQRQPESIQSYNRFMNVVGNIIGDSTYSLYQEAACSSSGSGEYQLGYSNGNPNCDSTNVQRTLMRWGNWDYVTNAVRWCGNSSDTGWSTTCGSTSEVPSGITNFPNPVPTVGDTGAGQSALPASFYLSSKPSWWPSAKPWPPIGPDVTAGNVGECSGGSYPGVAATSSGQCTGGTLVSAGGGHVYSIPAMDCYLNVMGGPPDGSGGPLSFNAGTCYPQSSRPAAPTGLTAVAD